MTTSNKELISRTLTRQMMTCIEEYRAIKNKTSTQFKTVQEFCEYHKENRKILENNKRGFYRRFTV